MSESLRIRKASDVVTEALNTIELERSGIQTGLYCRFKQFNRVMGRYWRFRTINFFGGLSGHGKSAIVNMLEEDFSNMKAINPMFKKKVIVLAFKYEMSAQDELLRNVGGKLKKSYSYLLSSEFNRDTKKYNTISDEEYERIKVELNQLQDRDLYYVEMPGTLEQLWTTFVVLKKEYPEAEFVVTLDHTLLSKKLNERDDGELIQATAYMALRLKKIGNAMVIFLGQLNTSIEATVRRENPALHYPIKSDIHYGAQFFWICDTVTIFHRPELLDIKKYGTYRLDTNNLLHAKIIKGRNIGIGDLWFKAIFSEGRVEEINPFQENNTIQLGIR